MKPLKDLLHREIKLYLVVCQALASNVTQVCLNVHQVFQSLAKFHLKLLQVFQRTAVTGRLTLVGQRPIKITLVHLSVRQSVLQSKFSQDWIVSFF